MLTHDWRFRLLLFLSTPGVAWLFATQWLFAKGPYSIKIIYCRAIEEEADQD